MIVAGRAAVLAVAVLSTAGCGPSRKEQRALVLLANQGPLCAELGEETTSLWQDVGPYRLVGSAESRFRKDRAGIEAGLELVKEALAGVDSASERGRALMDLYEEQAKLCRLAVDPQGSQISYGAERLSAEQAFEGKLARAKMVIGKVATDDVSLWRGEWRTRVDLGGSGAAGVRGQGGLSR